MAGVGEVLDVQKTCVSDLSSLAELMCLVQKAVMWYSTSADAGVFLH